MFLLFHFFSSNLQVIIEAVRNGVQSDIAIDDISFVDIFEGDRKYNKNCFKLSRLLSYELGNANLSTSQVSSFFGVEIWRQSENNRPELCFS